MNITNRIVDKIVDKMMDSIEPALIGKIAIRVSYTDEYYQQQKILNYLYELDKEKFSVWESGGSTNNDHWLLGGARYVLRFDRNNFLFVVFTDEQQHNRTVSILTLWFIGPDKRSYKKRFMRNVFSKPPKLDVMIITGRRDDIYMKVMPRTIDSIVMNHEEKAHLVNRLAWWMGRKSWYLSHGLPYKLGILLYGEPGTGKSSLVRAISHMLGNCPISTVSCDKIEQAMATIIANHDTNKFQILLLEDIDMLFPEGNRNPKEAKSVGEYKIYRAELETQQALFQLLDGVISIDNLVIIATTNYYDRLDEGLVRPSRFSITVEFDYFNRDMALEMARNFGLGEEFLDSLHLEYPVQPALLQDLIMGYEEKKGDK